MKVAWLLHNPKSGKANHTKENLVSLVRAKGFECIYVSIRKKGWDKMDRPANFIIIAGGDGTVRKVAHKLLEKNHLHKSLPIVILPLGTANNIAAAIQLPNSPEAALDALHNSRPVPFDVGRISCQKTGLFFFESFGFGIFASLMRKMKNEKKNFLSTANEINHARKRVLQTIESYKPRQCIVNIDGAGHSGKFLLVEVMNTCQIGPNLGLNPTGSVHDGLFEIILISESETEKLEKYIEDKIADRKVSPMFSPLKGKQIDIKWKGARAHADDEIIKTAKWESISVALHKDMLRFLVPAV